jgi:hypothetical protein
MIIVTLYIYQFDAAAPSRGCGVYGAIAGTVPSFSVPVKTRTCVPHRVLHCVKDMR